MTQCNAGHFFDEQQHSACPYCTMPIDIPPPGRTVPVKTGPPDAGDNPGRPAGPAAPTMPMRPAAGATVRLVQEKLGIDPVVGWLVCVEGADRGRDFRLRSEKNFIGRDSSMQVNLSDDTVSRSKHAAVAFEPEKREFWLIPGESTGLVYLNDEVVHAPTRMKDRDVARVGKSRLKLVTFVGDAFHWE
jgi:hypothetical protein